MAQMVKTIHPQCGRPGFNPWVGNTPWRREWQPTPVFLPGKSHGQRSLVGCSPRGHKELDTTEQLTISLSYNRSQFQIHHRKMWIYSHGVGWRNNYYMDTSEITIGFLPKTGQSDQTSPGSWWEMRNLIRYGKWENVKGGRFWLNWLSWPPDETEF